MIDIEHLDLAPDGFLDHKPEDAAYHRAFQAAGLPDFRFGYLVARRDGQRVAVLPYFVMNFRVNTMLPEGRLKRALDWLRFDIACVGHPSTDLGHFDGEVSAAVLAAANDVLRTKAKLVAYKGFGPDLPLPGFIKLAGLPVALLTIRGDYWSQLSSERRNNLKRKLRKADGLDIRLHHGVDDALAAQLHTLYLQTYERAVVKFELLTPAYFTATSSVSRYLLFYEGARLIGFVQLICKAPQMVFRYLGMDYRVGQERGLYFLLFLKAIEICVREGLTELESGATSYDFKRKIGSDIMPTWIYYRHSNPALHWALGKLKFMLEPSAAELR